VNDLLALRALTHPVRQRLLRTLAGAGRATATELAERVGESPANCSWHLRQLARYGFVTEAGGGAGRQRPWRIADPLVDAGGNPMVGFAVQATTWLAPEELAALSADIQKIIKRYAERRATDRPRSSRPVHLVAWGVPSGDLR
jgi:DNA-binding transcriptional ArsR family regulator